MPMQRKPQIVISYDAIMQRKLHRSLFHKMLLQKIPPAWCKFAELRDVCVNDHGTTIISLLNA